MSMSRKRVNEACLTQSVCIAVPSDEHRRWTKLAHERGMSFSALVRKLLENFEAVESEHPTDEWPLIELGDE